MEDARSVYVPALTGSPIVRWGQTTARSAWEVTHSREHETV